MLGSGHGWVYPKILAMKNWKGHEVIENKSE
jgi:hypothetical protein